MRKMTTTDNVLNCGFANPKLGRKHLSCVNSRLEKLSNLPCLFISYFSHSVFFSTKVYCSSFLSRVSHVFCVRANKEMIWIAASRIVAFVKNMKSDRDFSIFYFPSYSAGNVTFPSKPKLTIFFGSSMPQPRPTFFWRLNQNIIPKTFWHWFSSRLPSLFCSKRALLWSSGFRFSGSRFSTFRAKNRGSILNGCLHVLYDAQPLAFVK